MSERRVREIKENQKYERRKRGPVGTTVEGEKNREEENKKINKTFPKACLTSCGKSNITPLFIALQFQDKGERETSK